MLNKSYRRTVSAKVLSLLLVLTLLFVFPISTVWAAKDGDKDPVDKKELLKESIESGEPIEGQGVHADPETFEKNFCLSPDQKIYTITQIEKVISLYLDPEMSDLEKYYTIAKWANSRVIYDSDFWNCAYNFDYYRHQWDAYGGMKEDELSVCAGIAIFYSNLCHAAGLPCKFVRLDPTYLDHTITYIPDINGNAYYADITENDFLMSKNACSFAPFVDKEFAGIPDNPPGNPSDGTYEYLIEVDVEEVEDPLFGATDIKECWQNKISYQKWFKEYALHEDTDKENWQGDYDEQGSGRYGTHRARYDNFADYPAQTYENRPSDALGIWFLDDFYWDPAKAAEQISGKEFDEQFLDISGVKGNYDCADEGELVTAVYNDISVRYFPSVDENDTIVAKAAKLEKGVDYTVSYAFHDNETGEEVLTIQGDGEYSEACQIRVRMNSASVAKAPTRINGLVYNGSPQRLVEPGEAADENDTMVYAACKASEDPDQPNEPDSGDYSTEVPEKTEAGRYDVWYKVKGDGVNHSDMPAQYLGRSVGIYPQNIDNDENPLVELSQIAFTYNGKEQKPSVRTTLVEGTDYTVSWPEDPSIDAGEYAVEIDGVGNYSGYSYEYYEICPADNPMKLKGKKAKVKSSKLKKKKQTIKCAKAIKVKGAQGNLKYKLVSAKKGSKNFKKKFKINAKTGNVTVKKGLKKGTYKVKVKVKAAGNNNYSASSWKKVTFKVRVK